MRRESGQNYVKSLGSNRPAAAGEKEDRDSTQARFAPEPSWSSSPSTPFREPSSKDAAFRSQKPRLGSVPLAGPAAGLGE